MRKRVIIAVYVVLLFLSLMARHLGKEPEISPASQVIELPAFDGDRQAAETVRLVYQTFASDGTQAVDSLTTQADRDARPVIVLLHGSPGRAADFTRLAPHLKNDFRLIAPDLPG